MNTKNYRESVPFLFSLLYRSVLVYIEHYDAAFDNAVAIEIVLLQDMFRGDWLLQCNRTSASSVGPFCRANVD